MNINAAMGALLQRGSIVILVREEGHGPKGTRWSHLQMTREVAEVLRADLDIACRGEAPPPPAPASSPAAMPSARQRAVTRTAALFASVNGGPAAFWERVVDAYELVEKLESELARVCTNNAELGARVALAELELEIARRRPHEATR